MHSSISPEKEDTSKNHNHNKPKIGTGRGYYAALGGNGSDNYTMNNKLEMSLESSFFDGSSFIEDGPLGGKAHFLNNNH